MSQVKNFIFETTKKRIANLKRGKRFIDYYDSREFSADISDLREMIFELSKQDPATGFDMMLDFINTHEKVIERCDDSGGYIAYVYLVACQNLGTIGKSFNLDLNDAVNLVFDMCTNNHYGIFGDIISDFKDILGDIGLEILKSKFLGYMSEELINKKVLEEQNDYEDSWGEKKDFDELRKNVIGNINWTIISGLKKIADCRNDVDEYIQALAFPNTSYSYDDFYEADEIEIAKRLIKHNRASEALEWLSFVNSDPYIDEAFELKIKAFEILDEFEEAQQLRIEWFFETLDPEIFDSIIEHENSDLKDKFIKEAIDKSFEFRNVYLAMHFLTKKKFLDECSILVQKKIGEISGEYYEVVRPTANALKKEGFHLSAVLLYRKLIEFVMDSPKSKYYKYAVKDLHTCEELDKEISDYAGFPSHEEYYKSFCLKHKNKRSFWGKY